MSSDLIHETLTAWTQGQAGLRARIAVFERVRDIPYSYPASRDPGDVLRQNRGSCSGKHRLLGDMFHLLGLQVRHVICTHRFNESLIAFPEPMQALLRKNQIVDLHDYLQVSEGSDWIDVDATWQRPLRDFGFPVNEDWDGRQSMALSVIPEELMIAAGDPEKVKEELLSRLTPRQRALRKQFLESLSAWVQDLTAEELRDDGA
jgi:hypothetical protein